MSFTELINTNLLILILIDSFESEDDLPQLVAPLAVLLLRPNFYLLMLSAEKVLFEYFRSLWAFSI